MRGYIILKEKMEGCGEIVFGRGVINGSKDN
jgi:hypothetical protein